MSCRDCEPENVESMADSIYRLHCKPELGLKRADRAAGFLKDHGWERQGPELVTFYRALMETKK